METTRVQNRSYVPRLAFVATTFRRITLCSCHPLQSSVFHFIFANLFLCMLSDSFGFHHQVPVSLFLPEDTLTLPVSLTTLTLARPVFWKLLPPPSESLFRRKPHVFFNLPPQYSLPLSSSASWRNYNPDQDAEADEKKPQHTTTSEPFFGI